MTNWTATAGIDWDDAGKARRIEAGEPVPDRLVRAAPWLADQGHVIEGGAVFAAQVVGRGPLVPALGVGRLQLNQGSEIGNGLGDNADIFQSKVFGEDATPTRGPKLDFIHLIKFSITLLRHFCYNHTE